MTRQPPRGSRARAPALAALVGVLGLGAALVACGALPNRIDVSGYPPDMQARYDLFERRCTRCHELERPLNAQRGRGRLAANTCAAWPVTRPPASPPRSSARSRPSWSTTPSGSADAAPARSRREVPRERCALRHSLPGGRQLRRQHLREPAVALDRGERSGETRRPRRHELRHERRGRVQGRGRGAGPRLGQRQGLLRLPRLHGRHGLLRLDDRRPVQRARRPIPRAVRRVLPAPRPGQPPLGHEAAALRDGPHAAPQPVQPGGAARALPGQRPGALRHVPGRDGRALVQRLRGLRPQGRRRHRRPGLHPQPLRVRGRQQPLAHRRRQTHARVPQPADLRLALVRLGFERHVGPLRRRRRADLSPRRPRPLHPCAEDQPAGRGDVPAHGDPQHPGELPQHAAGPLRAARRLLRRAGRATGGQLRVAGPLRRFPARAARCRSPRRWRARTRASTATRPGSTCCRSTGIKLKLSYEYWHFTDFPAAQIVHSGLVGTF